MIKDVKTQKGVDGKAEYNTQVARKMPYDRTDILKVRHVNFAATSAMYNAIMEHAIAEKMKMSEWVRGVVAAELDRRSAVK